MDDDWKEIAEAIIRRDSHRCKCCHTVKNLTAHHILPRHDGGNDDQKNLITLCGVCHDLAEMGQLTFEQYANGYLFKTYVEDYPKTYIAVNGKLKFVGRSFFNGNTYELQRARPRIVDNWLDELKGRFRMKKKVTTKSELTKPGNKNSVGRRAKIFLSEIPLNNQKGTKLDEVKTSRLDSQKETLFANLGRVKILEEKLNLKEYRIFQQELEYWQKFYPEWIEEFAQIIKG